jgi:hypothetical protein
MRHAVDRKDDEPRLTGELLGQPTDNARNRGDVGLGGRQ